MCNFFLISFIGERIWQLFNNSVLLLNLLEQKKSGIGTVDLAVILYNNFVGFSDFPALANSS